MTTDRPGEDGRPESLAFLLSKIGSVASKSFAAALSPLVLEPRQFAVLNYVALAEGDSQKALAVAVGIPASRMVAIVDNLEERGLIERRAHPSDRRHRSLFLTSGGRKLLAEARRVVTQNERKLFAPLGIERREQLFELLHEVATELGVGDVHPDLQD